MKKSDLRKIISEVVQRKLNETDGKRVASVVDKIMTNTAVNEIQVLTHYGSERLEIMEVYEHNGVLYLTVNANSVNETDKLGEVLDTNSAAAANPTLTKLDPAQKDQATLDDLQKKLDKTSNGIRKSDSNMAKRTDTINKANRKDELDKQRLTKQQGPIIKKMDQVKEKMKKYQKDEDSA